MPAVAEPEVHAPPIPLAVKAESAGEVATVADAGRAGPTREQIERLERQMRALDGVAIEPVHHFAEGLYAREITIPAGVLLTGKVHATEHLNIVSKGCITVWTEDGMKTVRAPFTMVSRPGTKRVGFAHEDTVWTTIHANPDNLRDLDALEARLIVAPTIDYAAREVLP